MSDRKEITKRLSIELEEYINPKKDTRIYWAKEVTIDYATEHPVRVDYMKFVPLNNSASGIEKGDFYCYEIKSSLADFHSKNGHNFLGDFNYYVMPEGLYKLIENKAPYGVEAFDEHKNIPWEVGVIVECEDSSGGHYLELRKKARRKNRDKSVAEILLMMFRSANRDRI